MDHPDWRTDSRISDTWGFLLAVIVVLLAAVVIIFVF